MDAATVINVEGIEAVQASLRALASPAALRTVMEAAGQGVRVAAVRHFRDREAEPEKTDGFPKFGQTFGKKGFWSGNKGNSVEEAVGPVVYLANNEGVAIPIESPALAHKADPNPPPITPKGGRKFLAIPANARAAMWAGMPRDFDVPGGMKLATVPTPAGRWMKALVAKEDFLRTVQRGKRAGQRAVAAAGKATTGALQPQFWLVRKVQTAYDPRALPDVENLTQKANDRARSVLDRLVAAGDFQTPNA